MARSPTAVCFCRVTMASRLYFGKKSMKNQITSMLKLNKASSIHLNCILGKDLTGEKNTLETIVLPVIRSSLVIHRLYICELTYLLKLICNPQINTPSTSVGIDQRQQGGRLPSCFSSRTVQKCPSHGLFSATFFTS